MGCEEEHNTKLKRIKWVVSRLWLHSWCISVHTARAWRFDSRMHTYAYKMRTYARKCVQSRMYPVSRMQHTVRCISMWPDRMHYVWMKPVVNEITMHVYDAIVQWTLWWGARLKCKLVNFMQTYIFLWWGARLKCKLVNFMQTYSKWTRLKMQSRQNAQECGEVLECNDDKCSVH